MVPQRPVFHSDIGDFLAHLRRVRGWSQRETVVIARQRGIALSLGSLRFLEEGKTKHPSRGLLEGVASLYDVPFPMLVQRFVEANYGIGIRVVGVEGEQTASDPTLARVIALETRVARYQSTIGELRDMVDRAAIAANPEEMKSS